jgi:hypothetical protein
MFKYGHQFESCHELCNIDELLKQRSKLIQNEIITTLLKLKIVIKNIPTVETIEIPYDIFVHITHILSSNITKK